MNQDIEPTIPETSFPPATQMPPVYVNPPQGLNSNKKKWLVLALIIILGLPLISWGLRDSFKNMFDGNNNPPVGGTPDYENKNNQSACGDWPGISPEFQYLFQTDQTIPSGLQDVPQYPGNEPIGTIGGVGITLSRVFCANASTKTVFEYYQNYSIAPWRKSRVQLSDDYVPLELNNKPNWATDYQVWNLDKDGEDGKTVTLQFQMFESAGKTVIIVQGRSI